MFQDDLSRMTFLFLLVKLSRNYFYELLFVHNEISFDCIFFFDWFVVCTVYKLLNLLLGEIFLQILNDFLQTFHGDDFRVRCFIDEQFVCLLNIFCAIFLTHFYDHYLQKFLEVNFGIIYFSIFFSVPQISYQVTYLLIAWIET